MTEKDKEDVMRKVEDALCKVGVVAHVLDDQAELKDSDKSLVLCAYSCLMDLAHAYIYNEIDSMMDLQVIIDKPRD